MHEIPNGTNVIGQFFGECECFAHQSATTLAQCVVKALNMIGLTTILPNCTVTFCWQDVRICIPEIGKADGTLTIDRRKFLPKTPRKRLRTRTNRHTHDFARCTVTCEPYPLLARMFRWRDVGRRILLYPLRPSNR